MESYGNNRYSFKIEFDHYDSTNTYYGLDKLCLNNIIQDNTYMKDYLTYQMMNKMGVASPLCSYVYITVNNEDWGLYLAVEGVEESFLQRNYGKDYGELYKPDSQSMGGGRGNGKDFDANNSPNGSESESTGKSSNLQTLLQSPYGAKVDSDSDAGNQMTESTQNSNIQRSQASDRMTPPGKNGGNNSSTDSENSFGQRGMPGGMTPPTNSQNASESEKSVQSNSDPAETPDGQKPDGIGGSNMISGNDDVLLKYIDDEADSYSNIFNNAKTDISDNDKERLINALKKLSNGEDLENTIDIDKVIRYFVVHNFVLNFDSYTGSMIHNYYLYEKDGQMQMIPWDYNLAFGGFESAGSATNLVNYPIDSPVSGGNTEDRPMIAWIFENEEYTSIYHKYFAEFISEYFDNGYFEDMIDNVASMISPYVEKDPTKFCTYDEFETGVSTLKKFCLLRAESISGQLDGTIGSTADTQDSSTLINADDIKISDMGSMNNSMNGKTEQTRKDKSDNEQTQQGSNDVGEPPELSNGGSGTNDNNTESSNTASEQTQMPPESPNQNNADYDESKSAPQSFGNANNQKQNPNENSMNGEKGQTSGISSSWPYLVISIGILAAGLVFAVIYKRRR